MQPLAHCWRFAGRGSRLLLAPRGRLTGASRRRTSLSTARSCSTGAGGARALPGAARCVDLGGPQGAGHLNLMSDVLGQFLIAPVECVSRATGA
jgi:hypothetical protein